MAKNDPQKVVTGKVRLAFTRLTTPVEDDNGRLKYSAQVIVPKSDKKTMRDLRAAQQAALDAGLSSKFGGRKPKDWDTIKDGDEADLDAYPYLEDSWYFSVSANADRKPGLVDAKLREIIDASEIYSGMYARLSLRSFAYNTGKNAGVSFGLNHVQKVADGEALGMSSRPADDFEEVDEEDEDDELI